MKVQTIFLLVLFLLSACVAKEQASEQSLPITLEKVNLEPLSLPLAGDQLSPEEGNMLTWGQDDMDERFRSMEKLYPGHFIRSGKNIKPLPAGQLLQVDEQRMKEYMEEMKTAGILLLKDGKIILEYYARGHEPEKRYTSFSMAKSFMALLLGAAIKDGLIDSVNDRLSQYLPELNSSAYQEVTIAQALTMTSGVKWSEDYADPDADVAQMLAAAPPEGEDSTIYYMKQLPRSTDVGSTWNYSTGESHLLGVLIARVTNMPLAQYLSQKVWQPYGMEDDAFWMVDWSQNDLGGCCISSRLRDYGRFGMFIMDGAKGVVKNDYFKNMISRKADVPGYPDVGYGYQWWTYPNGRYGAQGLYGQNIIIDPEHKLVMVISSALKTSGDPKVSEKRFAYIIELLEQAAAK